VLLAGFISVQTAGGCLWRWKVRRNQTATDSSRSVL